MKPNTFKTGALAVVMMGLAARVLSGTAVAQGIDPGELVSDLHAIFGEHHDRAVHATDIDAVVVEIWRYHRDCPLHLRFHSGQVAHGPIGLLNTYAEVLQRHAEFCWSACRPLRN